jgi:glycosyltransferase involved in cell wall biosynthesis
MRKMKNLLLVGSVLLVLGIVLNIMGGTSQVSASGSAPVTVVNGVLTVEVLTEGVHSGDASGVVASSELARLRKAYCYSIVAWNPDNENQLYAAPNKFFESIADGIPPIAAPHPQCKLILDRYRCGILMGDWSFDSFTRAIRKAMDMLGTLDWEDMVSNCGRAVAAELTWDAQFDRLKQYLK